MSEDKEICSHCGQEIDLDDLEELDEEEYQEQLSKTAKNTRFKDVFRFGTYEEWVCATLGIGNVSLASREAKFVEGTTKALKTKRRHKK